MTDTTEKRPVGRPSLYDPVYCEKVIELGKLGKSIEQIASNLGIGTRTLFSWKDAHEEFRHALDEAKEYELDWWENIAQNMMIESKEGDKLNSSIWSRSMSARFPKKYRESTKTEITGADGAPLVTGINVTFVKPNE
jgi:transposase-like protein